uniref:Uncharacterized protein n=1 Tax=Mycena chlorophos TaxID=658473 RepID=A0ABQ0KX93_MYCCL|nr:predicted protein [Mycena chlorophos]
MNRTERRSPHLRSPLLALLHTHRIFLVSVLFSLSTDIFVALRIGFFSILFVYQALVVLCVPAVTLRLYDAIDAFNARALRTWPKWVRVVWAVVRVHALRARIPTVGPVVLHGHPQPHVAAATPKRQPHRLFYGQPPSPSTVLAGKNLLRSRRGLGTALRRLKIVSSFRPTALAILPQRLRSFLVAPTSHNPRPTSCTMARSGNDAIVGVFWEDWIARRLCDWWWLKDEELPSLFQKEGFVEARYCAA